MPVNRTSLAGVPTLKLRCQILTLAFTSSAERVYTRRTQKLHNEWLGPQPTLNKSPRQVEGAGACAELQVSSQRPLAAHHFLYPGYISSNSAWGMDSADLKLMPWSRRVVTR